MAKKKFNRKKYIHMYYVLHRIELQEYSRKYKAKHREKYRAYHRAYWAKNKKRLTAYIKEYQKRNKEKLRIQQAENYQKHKGARQAWAARYYEKNPMKTRHASSVRRARVFSAAGSHSMQDEENLARVQAGKCYYCGNQIKGKGHLDHMVSLSVGGSNWLDNLCFACSSCNLRKNKKSALLFIKQQGFGPNETRTSVDAWKESNKQKERTHVD